MQFLGFPEVGPCTHGNELSDFLKLWGTVLRNCHFSKETSSPWRLLTW